jgi:hypothetical protein
MRIGLAPGKFAENSTKLLCLDFTVYRIKCSTVLWLLELQIKPSRKVLPQVHSENNNRRTSNCQCSIYLKKNPIIEIFYISGWLEVLIIPDKWSSIVHNFMQTIVNLKRKNTDAAWVLFAHVIAHVNQRAR